jgi:hypothetical protein
MRQPQHNKSLKIVGIIIVLVVGVRLLSIIVPERTGRVDPRINLVQDQARQIAERQWSQQARAFNAASDGEVSRTEERIREATALATAASLFAARESLNRRTPATVVDLLAGVNSAGLMPPPIRQLPGQGEAISSRGTLSLRYRPEPLGIEVISLGKERLDGPAILVRVPDDDISEPGAGLYLATRLDQITVPAPFAPAAEVVALGFAREPLRAAKLPKPDATN